MYTNLHNITMLVEKEGKEKQTLKSVIIPLR